MAIDKKIPSPSEISKTVSPKDIEEIKKLQIDLSQLNSKFDNHIKDIFNEMKLIMPSLNNISWERLERDGFVTYPVESEFELGQDIIFNDGFPTFNKLAKITPTKLIMPNDELSKEFPLVLSTGRLLEHWHTGTMTRKALILDKLEPDPIIFMNENI